MPVTPVVITIAPHRSAHGPNGLKGLDRCATSSRSIERDDRNNRRAFRANCAVNTHANRGAVCQDSWDPVWELACLRWRPVRTRDVDWHTAIAGKPAPTLE